MSSPLIGHLVSTRETGCAGGDARERPVLPARSAGVLWAVLGTGGVAVRPRLGVCVRGAAGPAASPCRSRAGARRGPVPGGPGRLALAVSCRAARAACRRRGCAAATSRSSPPGGVPADLAGCAAGISRRPETPARCLAARAWRRSASAAGARAVSRPMPATGSGRDAIPGWHLTIARLLTSGHRGGGMVPARPSPAPSPPWPGSDGAVPGIPGSCRHGRRGWRWRAASALRAAVSPHQRP